MTACGIIDDKPKSGYLISAVSDIAILLQEEIRRLKRLVCDIQPKQKTWYPLRGHPMANYEHPYFVQQNDKFFIVNKSDYITHSCELLHFDGGQKLGHTVTVNSPSMAKLLQDELQQQLIFADSQQHPNSQH
jgi:hypothetical protein